MTTKLGSNWRRNRPRIMTAEWIGGCLLQTLPVWPAHQSIAPFMSRRRKHILKVKFQSNRTNTRYIENDFVVCLHFFVHEHRQPWRWPSRVKMAERLDPVPAGVDDPAVCWLQWVSAGRFRTSTTARPDLPDPNQWLLSNRRYFPIPLVSRSIPPGLFPHDYLVSWVTVSFQFIFPQHSVQSKFTAWIQSTSFLALPKPNFRFLDHNLTWPFLTGFRWFLTTLLVFEEWS